MHEEMLVVCDQSLTATRVGWALSFSSLYAMAHQYIPSSLLPHACEGRIMYCSILLGVVFL